MTSLSFTERLTKIAFDSVIFHGKHTWMTWQGKDNKEKSDLLQNFTPFDFWDPGLNHAVPEVVNLKTNYPHLYCSLQYFYYTEHFNTRLVGSLHPENYPIVVIIRDYKNEIIIWMYVLHLIFYVKQEEWRTMMLVRRFILSCIYIIYKCLIQSNNTFEC
jgi:hypothetical protein